MSDHGQMRTVIETVASDMQIFAPALDLLRVGNETWGGVLLRAFAPPTQLPPTARELVNADEPTYRLRNVATILVRYGTFSVIKRLMIIALRDPAHPSGAAWARELRPDIYLRLLAETAAHFATTDHPTVTLDDWDNDPGQYIDVTNMELRLLESGSAPLAEGQIRAWIDEAPTACRAYLTTYLSDFVQWLGAKGFHATLAGTTLH